MYITETTDNVRKLIENLETKGDISKLKFLIYIFGLLNNNQINDKNEANPDLMDDNISIFNFESIGLSSNSCTILLQYFVMIYNGITKTKDVYEDNGNIFGLKYTKEENELNSNFEKLTFNEKLDIFSEIIIRYDNEMYFNEKMIMIKFDSKLSGFDLAKQIQNFKN